jgi:hypothetical protein
MMREAIGGDISNHADGKAGAGEGLAEWIYEFELHLLGEAADIVAALDKRRGVFGWTPPLGGNPEQLMRFCWL